MKNINISITQIFRLHKYEKYKLKEKLWSRIFD